MDCHFHLFAAGQAHANARYVPAYSADYPAWWAAASAVGVGRGVLVQPSFLGTDNSRLCAELRQHPDTLRGIAVVDPTTTPDQLRQLAASGVRGIRLNLAGASHDLGAWRSATTLWDQLLQLGWHVELHTDAGFLPQVLPQLPDAMPLVLDHMAKPVAPSSTDQTIATLKTRARRSPVHVKLSGAYRLEGADAGAVARVLRDELGPQGLLWGSDWPCTNFEELVDYRRLFAAVHAWLGAEALGLALSSNPAALYWSEAES